MALDHVIVLAPRKPPYTRAAFQAHYEDFHAPLFYRYTAPAIARYLRNHIAGIHGDDPPFDTISEFAIRPEMRGWMSERLRSPETRDLEEDVQTFLAERGNAFPVRETPIAGPPRSASPGGAVAKRLLLLRKPAGVETPDFEAAARRLADALAPNAVRTTLTFWTEAAPPVDVMIALWTSGELPALGASAPDGVEVAYELDVVEYCTAWEDGSA